MRVLRANLNFKTYGAKGSYRYFIICIRMYYEYIYRILDCTIYIVFVFYFLYIHGHHPKKTTTTTKNRTTYIIYEYEYYIYIYKYNRKT